MNYQEFPYRQPALKRNTLPPDIESKSYWLGHVLLPRRLAPELWAPNHYRGALNGTHKALAEWARNNDPQNQYNR